MSEKKVYPSGFITFKPHENAPDFVKGILKITVRDFINFCRDNPDLLKDYKGKKQLPLQILEGDKGIYFVVDTWKPEKKDDFNDVPDLNPKDSDLPF